MDKSEAPILFVRLRAKNSARIENIDQWAYNRQNTFIPIKDIFVYNFDYLKIFSLFLNFYLFNHLFMNISIKDPLFCNETGRRKNNEDYIFPTPGIATDTCRLFLVCDGMGGHEDGELASQTVAESIAGYWLSNNQQPDNAQKVDHAIAAAIYQMDRLVKDSKGNANMGTTMTLAGIGKETILVAHVGDSRIYQIRPGLGIVYQSKDHSLVQTWVDAGLLTPEEARNHPKSNIITQVIQPGGMETIHPEVVVIKDIKNGDYLFLCTDGVTESIDDPLLVEILSGQASDNEKMDSIKQICQENSRDNYSAYLIPLVL